MPIGRTFVRFHALAKYLKFTSPWGSGEPTKTAPAERMDSQTAAYEAARLGLLTPRKTIGVEDLSPALRGIVLEQ